MPTLGNYHDVIVMAVVWLWAVLLRIADSTRNCWSSLPVVLIRRVQEPLLCSVPVLRSLENQRQWVCIALIPTMEGAVMLTAVKIMMQVKKSPHVGISKTISQMDSMINQTVLRRVLDGGLFLVDLTQ